VKLKDNLINLGVSRGSLIINSGVYMKKIIFAFLFLFFIINIYCQETKEGRNINIGNTGYYITFPPYIGWKIFRSYTEYLFWHGNEVSNVVDWEYEYEWNQISFSDPYTIWDSSSREDPLSIATIYFMDSSLKYSSFYHINLIPIIETYKIKILDKQVNFNLYEHISSKLNRKIYIAEALIENNGIYMHILIMQVRKDFIIEIINFLSNSLKKHDNK
jgi:hypothetical protein